MSSGKYTELVWFEKPSGSASAPNDYGELDLSTAGDWQKVCQRWISWESEGGREVNRAKQLNADVGSVHYTLHDSQTGAIRPSWSILLADGRRLEILNVQDVDNRHHEMRLECREFVSRQNT